MHTCMYMRRARWSNNLLNFDWFCCAIKNEFAYSFLNSSTPICNIILLFTHTLDFLVQSETKRSFHGYAVLVSYVIEVHSRNSLLQLSVVFYFSTYTIKNGLFMATKCTQKWTSSLLVQCTQLRYFGLMFLCSIVHHFCENTVCRNVKPVMYTHGEILILLIVHR